MLNKLRKIVSNENLFIDEPMGKHTTFKAGGKAALYITPGNIMELSSVIKLFNIENYPYYIIGNGSNILVKDSGYEGAIIKIGSNFNTIEINDIEEGALVKAGAGATLGAVAVKVYEKGLTGMEPLGGIPGTVGGAVTMNAGAYGSEIKDIIVDATVIDKNGEIKVISREELELSYRHSIIAQKEYLVIESTFMLKKGNKEEILSSMNDYKSRRLDKQPLELPSAGSTFKRPEGYFAGKLIMDAGLRGYRIGDAMVSEKHCGFVVNVGECKASDIIELIEYIKKTVFEKYGIELEPEVKII